MTENENGRPGRGGRESSTAIKNMSIIPPTTVTVSDLDAHAEAIRGRFVVQVVIDAERGHRRTFVYRNCAAAERAVRRARERGQVVHVSLAQLLPVGVVSGLGGGL